LAGYIPRRYTRPKTVTHAGTNRARRALTSFMRRTPSTSSSQVRAVVQSPRPARALVAPSNLAISAVSRAATHVQQCTAEINDLKLNRNKKTNEIITTSGGGGCARANPRTRHDVVVMRNRARDRCGNPASDHQKQAVGQ